ncbi:adenosylcobinamide amidohydrolase [Aeribacillus composti]|uniref:adenosylcobinamide amidohydrolase n=1 Tax=Aeribacillus composti TaxID=1868734 RepID=UPI002E1FF7DF|nr:adenosylcobinamide amidohydrolase [Aeribacillus composti]MED0747070.1 adenosylcobinamide amidohydrolase [Aeribacillus composti]
MLQIKNIAGGYQRRNIIENLSFIVEKGEMFGILGPNGSGKTTLLKMISGLIPVRSGTIELEGKPLQAYSAKQLARKIASLPQNNTQMFDYTVWETVALGRYPFQRGFLKRLTYEDEQVIQQVMEFTNVTKLKHLSIKHLSGGEKQRVFLAQALAQNPSLLLLDEPTNHLDITYQKMLLDQLKKWTKSHGLTVVSIFHDINLASLYCDKMLLLKNGQSVLIDDPNAVLNEKTIHHVYDVSAIKQSHPEIARPQMMLSPEHKHDEKKVFTKEDVIQTKELIYVKAASPLKTFSSAVVGGGFGWHRHFVNRHVSTDDHVSGSQTEMINFLLDNGFSPNETIGMLTSSHVEDGVVEEWEEEGISIIIVVTASISHGADASKNMEKHEHVRAINTWMFINGHLSDQAFIEGMVTATEAKTKALFDEGIIDSATGSSAAEASMDSVLLAATQTGSLHHHAGTGATLGKLIAKGVYESTVKAIQNNKQRWTIND